MAISVEIYEEIRRCREIYGYGQRQTARLLKISRNTVKKYWEGTTVPWERNQGIFAKINLSHPTRKRQEKTEPLVKKSRV